MTEPTPEEISQFIASCNLARHGWDRFEQGNRRSAARILAKMATERESTAFGSSAHDRASTELNNRICPPRRTRKENPVDFRTAFNTVIAELTPQPWDYTTADGTTLRIMPAGLRETAGYAEVLVRITRQDATGLCEFGITGPDSRGVAEVGVTSSALPDLIEALTGWTEWEDTQLVCGTLAVTPGAGGVMVRVTEIHGQGQEVTVSTIIPEAQRLPLASALRRALDVAHSWES